MPGAGIDDYPAVLDQCYGKSPLRSVFREAMNKEMDADMAPLREQLHMCRLQFLPLPGSSGCRRAKTYSSLSRTRAIHHSRSGCICVQDFHSNLLA